MLFNSEEKNILIGALATGVIDGALEGYFAYASQGGLADPRADPMIGWLYTSFNEWIPPVDDLIALVGVPFLLWGMGKYRKSSKMREMGIGGMVYGFSEIIGWTYLKVTRLATGKSIYRYRVIGGSLQ